MSTIWVTYLCATSSRPQTRSLDKSQRKISGKIVSSRICWIRWSLAWCKHCLYLRWPEDKMNGRDHNDFHWDRCYWRVTLRNRNHCRLRTSCYKASSIDSLILTRLGACHVPQAVMHFLCSVVLFDQILASMHRSSHVAGSGLQFCFELNFLKCPGLSEAMHTSVYSGPEQRQNSSAFHRVDGRVDHPTRP